MTKKIDVKSKAWKTWCELIYGGQLYQKLKSIMRRKTGDQWWDCSPNDYFEEWLDMYPSVTYYDLTESMIDEACRRVEMKIEGLRKDLVA